MIQRIKRVGQISLGIPGAEMIISKIVHRALSQKLTRVCLFGAIGLGTMIGDASAANFLQEKDKIICDGDSIHLTVESLTLKSNLEIKEQKFASIIYRREDTGFVIQFFGEKEGKGNQISIVLIDVECVLILHYY